MAQYFDVNPDNPQPRALAQVAKILQDGGIIAYPTDSGFALGCALGNTTGLERMRRIRKLSPKHHFTLVVSDFAKLGQYIQLENWEFRALKAAPEGQFTFIVRASRELPRALAHPKKRTVGIRIPANITAQSLLSEHGAPLASTTLILPGEEEPMSQGWEIKDRLEYEIDAVLDSGDAGNMFTTVIDFSSGEAEAIRVGLGDPELFVQK